MEYCAYVFKKGKTKGTTCPRRVYENKLCKAHQPKANKTDDEKCEEFVEHPDFNPFTKRKIKVNGPTFTQLLYRCVHEAKKKNSPIILKGRWEVVRSLATGGCGAVYSGVDRVEGKQVAIKFEPLNSDTLVREVTMLHALRSEPSVVRMLDQGIYDDKRYAVFPLLKKGTIYYGELVLAIKQVAKHQISHGDIKSANIMFDNQGRLVLIDFGLANRISKRPRVSASHITGTPVFMSLNSHKGVITYRNDLESVVFMILIERTPKTKNAWIYEKDLNKLFLRKLNMISLLFKGDETTLRTFGLRNGDNYHRFIKEVYQRNDGYHYNDLARILSE